MLPLRALSGLVDIRRRCETMDVDFPDLEGGPLVGRGRIRNELGKTNGAFLLRARKLGVLSAGIELDAGHTSVSPAVGDDWLARRLAALDEKAGAGEADGAGCYGVTKAHSSSRQSCE